MTRFVCNRTVIDLGKNVPAEKVVETVLEKDIQLVGLNQTSAGKTRPSGKDLQNHGGRSSSHGRLRKPDWGGLLRQGRCGECWDYQGSVWKIRNCPARMQGESKTEFCNAKFCRSEQTRMFANEGVWKIRNCPASGIAALRPKKITKSFFLK